MEAIELKIKWRTFLPCIWIPLAVGGLAAWLTREGIGNFAAMRRPPLSPPGWLFPVVWTILYLMMGAASYMVLTSGAETSKIHKSLFVYAAQLLANFIWPILFFGASWYAIALLEIVLLWILVLATTLCFFGIRTRAGNWMLAYLLWVTFAAYLNYGVYRLN